MVLPPSSSTFPSSRRRRTCRGRRFPVSIDQVVPANIGDPPGVPTDDFLNDDSFDIQVPIDQTVPALIEEPVPHDDYIRDWRSRLHRVLRKLIMARGMLEMNNHYNAEQRGAILRNLEFNCRYIQWVEYQIKNIVDHGRPNPRLESEANNLLSVLEAADLNVRVQIGSF